MFITQCHPILPQCQVESRVGTFLLSIGIHDVLILGVHTTRQLFISTVRSTISTWFSDKGRIWLKNKYNYLSRQNQMALISSTWIITCVFLERSCKSNTLSLKKKQIFSVMSYVHYKHCFSCCIKHRVWAPLKFHGFSESNTYDRNNYDIH